MTFIWNYETLFFFFWSSPSVCSTQLNLLTNDPITLHFRWSSFRAISQRWFFTSCFWPNADTNAGIFTLYHHRIWSGQNVTWERLSSGQIYWHSGQPNTHISSPNYYLCMKPDFSLYLFSFWFKNLILTMKHFPQKYLKAVEFCSALLW